MENEIQNNKGNILFSYKKRKNIITVDLNYILLLIL